MVTSLISTLIESVMMSLLLNVSVLELSHTSHGFQQNKEKTPYEWYNYSGKVNVSYKL